MRLLPLTFPNRKLFALTGAAQLCEDQRLFELTDRAEDLTNHDGCRRVLKECASAFGGDELDLPRFQQCAASFPSDEVTADAMLLSG